MSSMGPIKGVTVSESPVVVVLVTFPSDADVSAFARCLVAERLVACVSILSNVESVFWWNGEIATTPERQLILKTSADRLDVLQARLEALHPYDTAECLVLPATGEPRYLGWIREALDGRDA